MDIRRIESGKRDFLPLLLLGDEQEDMIDRYLDAGEEISALTADLSSGLSRLQETLADIQAIFDDAESAFDELQLPDDDEI